MLPSTHRAPAEVKEAFYDDLQAVVPSSDMLLERVGCVESESFWNGVQGMFGVQ